MARKTGSHSQITGPRIHEAALRLFAAHGFAAVSVRKIAAEVGVQAGAIYNYTADKQSLLFELLNVHMSELLDAVPKRSDAPMQDLEAFVRFHILFHLDRPDAVFMSYMELRNLSPENFVRIETQRRAYEDHLGQILADGALAGEMKVGDLRLKVMAMIAMLTGVTLWFDAGGRLSADEVASQYWDMARRLVQA